MPRLRGASRGRLTPPSVVLLILVLLAIGRAASAQGQEPPPDPREAKPERPTVATHAHTVAIGIVELEAGFQFQHPDPASSMLTMPVLFKIGLEDHLQLDIAPGWMRTSSAAGALSGIDDAVIGIKWQLTEGFPVLGDFAIQPTLKLQTGSVAKGTGSGTTDLNLLAISSHDFGLVALDLNAGCTLRSGDGKAAPQSSTFWTCSASFELSQRLAWETELFSYPGTSGPSGKPAAVAFLTGPTFIIDKSVVIDAGAIFNVTGFGGRAIYAGVTWNIGRLWTPREVRPQP